MKGIALLLSVISINLCLGQLQPVTSSLVIKLGADTIVVDTYTINNNRLYGKAFIRLFENHIRVYDVTLNPTGSISGYHVSAMDPVNSSLPLKPKSSYFPLRADMTWTSDTAYFNITKTNGEKLKMNWSASSIDFVAGWIPIFPLMDWTYQRLANSGKMSLNNLKTTNTWSVTDLSIRYQAQDTLIFGGPFIDYSKIIIGQDGISTINGVGSAYNFMITRTAPLDVDLIARRMSKKSAMIAPSPRDTATFNVHDNKIKIEYGRPFARGRIIFGGVVPYDSLWRTGANDPTIITIEKDIKVGKSMIPKGTYSLYSIPRKKSWTLIFSHDLDSWPTNPDRTREFASVELSVRHLSEKKEQFTIEIIEKEMNGFLKLSWDDTEAYVEFKFL